VVAEVIKPIGDPMTPEDFIMKFCGGIEPEKPAGLPQDVPQKAKYDEDGVIEDAPMMDIRRPKTDGGQSAL